MPWTNPKALTTEEVCAVTAFMLDRVDVVPEGFALSHEKLAEVHKRLAKRYGKSRPPCAPNLLPAATATAAPALDPVAAQALALPRAGTRRSP